LFCYLLKLLKLASGNCKKHEKDMFSLAPLFLFRTRDLELKFGSVSGIREEKNDLG
jgi:hypothetical protein